MVFVDDNLTRSSQILQSKGFAFPICKWSSIQARIDTAVRYVPILCKILVFVTRPIVGGLENE